jgi:maltooligosyltrehalose trehalohydrolase
VPGIPGCRTAGTTIVGEKALVARWTLGTGEQLSIAINFADASAACPAVTGDLLAESANGAWQTAKSGQVAARSAVAWVEPAR